MRCRDRRQASNRRLPHRRVLGGCCDRLRLASPARAAAFISALGNALARSASPTSDGCGRWQPLKIVVAAVAMMMSVRARHQRMDGPPVPHYGEWTGLAKLWPRITYSGGANPAARNTFDPSRIFAQDHHSR